MRGSGDELDATARAYWRAAAAVVGVGVLVAAPLAVLLRHPALVTAALLLGLGAAALAVGYPVHRRLVARLMASEECSRLVAREQAALRRVASTVAAEGAPGETFTQIARESGELLDADAGLVVRFRQMEAVTEGWWSRRQQQMTGGFPLASEGALAQVSRGAAAARVDDFCGLPVGDEVAVVAGRAGYRSSIAAPVAVDGILWGAVLAARCDGTFPEASEERLRHFAELAGIAVANAEARSALATQASTDPLTQLANHRVFHERLWAEAERALRHGRRLSLVLLDLDHFKQVNDVHGHRAGDEVLRTVARIISAESRSGEVVARIGGEELAWILPETDSLGAWQAAERARRTISRAFLGTAHPVTVSAGVCDLEQVSRRGGGAELFERTDAALYWAKTHGRDVCFRYTREVAEALAGRERAGATDDPGETMVSSSAAVRALAQALDSVDPSTLLHCGRVAMIASQLAVAVGWSRPRAALLREAATLHDIGKIGLPEAGGVAHRSSDEDIARRTHVEVSARIVSSVMSAEQTSWVRHHHERLDGSGYPDGLAGDDIPAGARILAVADAWDSLTAEPPSGRGVPGADAIAVVEGLAGAGLWAPAVAGLARLWSSGTVLGATAASAPRDAADD